MSDQSERRTDHARHPRADNEHSITAGPRGPVLMQDRYLIEKLAHFNRERIPERVVHAKGAGAYGNFAVTDDVTPVHPGGLPLRGRQADRDVPALLHRRRRAGLRGRRARPARLRAEVLHRGGQLRPRRQQHPGVLHPRPDQVPRLHPHPEARPAHRPARRRQCLGLLVADARVAAPGHLAVRRPRHPRVRYRHMNGFGSHTYQWINAAGEAFWVKYHFKTDQGIKNLTQAEADRAGRASTPTATGATCARPSSAATSRAGRCRCRSCRRPRRADYRFNPFDLTKVWPHERLPADRGRQAGAQPQPGELLRRGRAGRRSARRTSCPASGPRPDKMLQGRLFAYARRAPLPPRHQRRRSCR